MDSKDIDDLKDYFKSYLDSYLRKLEERVQVIERAYAEMESFCYDLEDNINRFKQEVDYSDKEIQDKIYNLEIETGVR